MLTNFLVFKNIKKSFLHPVFCTLIIFLSFSTPAFSEEPKIIRVALSDSSPPTSYLEGGTSKGMFKDILELLFAHIPEYQLIFKAEPWPRAQQNVQAGRMDLFITFPSEARKTYADFTTNALYLWDYGNLVYNVKNPRRSRIESAKSFEDLKELTFVSQEGIDWENENVPSFIKRLYSNKIITLLHLVLKRNEGDFFIMSHDQASYYARKLSYENQMGMKKVTFIPNANVHFHIGISKVYSGKAELLSLIESAMKNPIFIQKKKIIEEKYKKRI